LPLRAATAGATSRSSFNHQDYLTRRAARRSAKTAGNIVETNLCMLALDPVFVGAGVVYTRPLPLWAGSDRVGHLLAIQGDMRSAESDKKTRGREMHSVKLQTRSPNRLAPKQWTRSPFLARGQTFGNFLKNDRARSTPVFRQAPHQLPEGPKCPRPGRDLVRSRPSRDSFRRAGNDVHARSTARAGKSDSERFATSLCLMSPAPSSLRRSRLSSGRNHSRTDSASILPGRRAIPPPAKNS
jgi:hypothetical protein